LQCQCFVEIADFNNFARYVLAFREYPLRVYSHEIKGKRILSSGTVLANTLLVFYTPLIKEGRYISYQIKGTKEQSDIVNSTKQISQYSPIVNLESDLSPFQTKTKKIDDEFKPLKIKDLGSLARLAYDPELPDEPDLTLFTFPYMKKWVIGKITSIEMDDVTYCFNYLTLKQEPNKPFLRYSAQRDEETEFSDKVEHGFSYLSVIKLKTAHPIFGLS